MLISTTQPLPDHSSYQILGPVYGIACTPLVPISRAAEKPEDMYALALENARAKMEQHATALYGKTANAIIGVQVSPCAVPNLSYMLFVAVGTAVHMQPDNAKQKDTSPKPAVSYTDKRTSDDSSPEAEPLQSAINNPEKEASKSNKKKKNKDKKKSDKKHKKKKS